MSLLLVLSAAMLAQADEYTARHYASRANSAGNCLITATLQNANIASSGAVDYALSVCAFRIESAQEAFRAMLADRQIDASSPEGQRLWSEQLGDFRQTAVNAVEDRRHRLGIPIR